jgi:hypothetical protein
MNPGTEQNVPVNAGGNSYFPDLVLFSQERGRRLQAVVEVETGESVNHLEALAQWANFAKLRAEFFLYVPSGMVDVARRLCDDNQIRVNEIWSFHNVGDEVRFTLVHRNREVPLPKARIASQAPARVKPRAPVTAAAKNRASRGSKAGARGKTAKKSTRAQKRK